VVLYFGIQVLSKFNFPTKRVDIEKWSFFHTTWTLKVYFSIFKVSFDIAIFRDNTALLSGSLRLPHTTALPPITVTIVILRVSFVVACIDSGALCHSFIICQVILLGDRAWCARVGFPSSSAQQLIDTCLRHHEVFVNLFLS